MAKWFIIGFVVRVALAIGITLLMTKDLEAVWAYFMDLPTVGCLTLVEAFSPGLAHRLEGNHPYYLAFNFLGSFLWGFLFMFAGFTVSLIKTRRTE